MARHNREGRGEDQRGTPYTIGYQPDWLRQVKVTRDLESGRQSTKTLFRNPETPEQDPGGRVRTHITSEDLGIDIEVAVHDPRRIVKRVIIETEVSTESGESEAVVFVVSSFHKNAADSGE